VDSHSVGCTCLAEGEGVDFLGELLELSGWTLVDDDETEPELP
jgi:hypothetical protein